MLALHLFVFLHHVFLPNQLEGCFTASRPPNKPWSKVPSILPRGIWLHFYRSSGSFSITAAHRFRSSFANSCSRTFSDGKRLSEGPVKCSHQPRFGSQHIATRVTVRPIDCMHVCHEEGTPNSHLYLCLLYTSDAADE